jgi:hypothetical protein
MFQKLVVFEVPLHRVISKRQTHQEMASSDSRASDPDGRQCKTGFLAHYSLEARARAPAPHLRMLRLGYSFVEAKKFAKRSC